MSNVIQGPFDTQKCRGCGETLPAAWMIEELCCHCGDFPMCGDEADERKRRDLLAIKAKGASLNDLIGCCEVHKLSLFRTASNLELIERIAMKGNRSGDPETVRFARKQRVEALDDRDKFLQDCPECFALDAASRGRVS